MIPIPEILVEIQTRWDLSGTLATYVPGGLWHKRANETTVAPYATITITADSVTMTTTGHYVAFCNITISVWSSEQLGSVALRAITTGISSIMALGAPIILANGSLTGLAPDAATIDLDDLQREAADVIQYQTVYRGMLQGRAK